MPIDPVHLELQLADIMFDRATSASDTLSARQKLARDTEDIVLSLLQLMSKDPTLSSPEFEGPLKRVSAELAVALHKWMDGDPPRAVPR